ncbi:phenazine biosynthesis protein PhzF family [Fervidobacterium changbaicum]|uniref:PhzF family phenazine biosynthesis protein n=2 Tax=Fervidobacterium TaxID=2422 RepID=A0AAI8CKN3_FERIS|nr:MULTISPECIES: PhzF family phenazine biosynthesis protein [Fervidobacterium]AMW32134.1 PhzF family phenazine biosynthesis protein [Fervidobacterium islandicum]QAV33905.1 PhzF family phenazine biosynthesis protein [Fervidobacterium changbaicum]SDH72930.1 phenazine biosynthesis protein PhzF family [Fervidobacterium changbaicum]
MKFFVADAFTNKPFLGNPAGVVILENQDNLSDSVMQNIAKEVRFSETAFVRSISKDEFDIRYFTPVAEVDLCGHATIGSFKVLEYLELVKAGCVYKAHTRAGIIDVSIEEGKVMMEQATPVMGEELEMDDIKKVAELLGIEEDEIGDRKYTLKPQAVSTGLWDLIVPVKSKQTLFSLSPDFDSISDYCRINNIVSFHIFTLDETRALANCRDFAPLYGIPEESATGTANGALIYYLYKHGIVEPEKMYEVIQGETMNRMSNIFAKVHLKDGVYKAYVGGDAKIVIEGSLLI